MVSPVSKKWSQRMLQSSNRSWNIFLLQRPWSPNPRHKLLINDPDYAVHLVGPFLVTWSRMDLREPCPWHCLFLGKKKKFKPKNWNPTSPSQTATKISNFIAVEKRKYVSYGIYIISPHFLMFHTQSLPSTKKKREISEREPENPSIFSQILHLKLGFWFIISSFFPGTEEKKA